MQGALALAGGVLYVARQAATPHVRPYDLLGQPLSGGFAVREPNGERCALAGLAADEDHRIWIGDGLSESVRAFSLFGRSIAAFAGARGGERDTRGGLSHLVDLCLSQPDEDDGPSLLVARGGLLRHAVQAFASDGQWIASLRPGGDPLGSFQDVRAIACLGRLAFVCEGRPGRIQVFRDGEFHYALQIPVRTGSRFVPVAVAPLAPDRLVVGCGGSDSALLLCDASGRLIRVLAEHGMNPGQVGELTDVAAEPASDGGEPCIAAMDQDGERVQVFSPGGRCFGEFRELPGRAL